MQTELAARKDRWRRFLAGSNNPHRYLFLVRYQPKGVPPRPWPWATNVPQRLEWIWQNYCRQCQCMEWLADDSLPYLDMLTGTELFAAAFGCDVYNPADNMPSARPLVSSSSEAARLKVPSLDAPSLKRVFDMADELQRRAGKEALMRTVDIQSPMDIAALIWDKNDFYLALTESPEAVKELAHKVKQLLTAFLDEWFKRYGRQHIAHFPDYFMDGGWTVSEDEVGVVNPEMFEELFLPELNELSDRYGGIAIHCCANSRHQWENFRKIRGLRLMNIIQPAAIIQQAFDFFGDHFVHWHPWPSDGDSATWKDRVPGGVRFVLEARAKTRDEALRLVETLSPRR
jgi:hypothetical protein